MMNDPRKSDGLIVPTKPSNNAERTAAEMVEGRGPVKGNASQQNVARTQSRIPTLSELERVRQAARKDRNAKFTALFHHITTERLRAAYLALTRKAAAGVDGVTWQQYGEDLERNLQDLHARLHRGAYRAKPSRRVFIPKADGQQRPLGIASLEDKIVQRAVVEIMNAIYESDFAGFSYGFRPGRSQHQALDALAVAILRKNVNWVLDADIRDFYGTIDHGWMVKFLEHRIADRRILRLIQKWLTAGVLADGMWTKSVQGAPQGATISCLLANIYLHYVFDLWVQQWRTRHPEDELIVVRYADDVVLGFRRRSATLRFEVALRDRLQKFGLELHPDKTRILRFGKFARAQCVEDGRSKPETFCFLGFTHICAKSRNGRFVLKRLTNAKRMRTRLKQIWLELRRIRHRPLPEQGAWLSAVVRGYFAYHAVPTNGSTLNAFRTEVARSWMRALRRRSQHDRMSWVRMRTLQNRWLPPVRILHPWPDERFDARTQDRSRVR